MNRSRLAALTAGAVLLVATVLVPATALAAGSGTLTVDPTPATTSVGSTFTVDINAAGAPGVFPSGASASVVFDQTKLAIVSVAKGYDFDIPGVGWAGFPTASKIAIANGTGKLSSVAAYFTDGTSSLADGDAHPLLTITFLAKDCSATALPLTLPVGPDDGGILDGTPGQPYGEPLSVTSVSGSVSIPCAGAPSPGLQSANITGTVDAGFFGLTCPTAVEIPLVRNATNTKDLTCNVSSNIIWTLNANDTKTGPTKGFMTDGAKVLANSMHVLSGQHPGPNPGDPPAWDFDQNLANGGQVGAGSNTTNVLLTLSQFGAAQDQPGNYGIQIVFAAVSAF